MTESMHAVRLTVNGVVHEVSVPARRLLSDALRHDLRLTGTHVGCVRADLRGHRRFLFEDPHAKAMDLMVLAQHPHFGRNAPGGVYWRHSPHVDFSLTPCPKGQPYVGLGEHTLRIIAGLGYRSEEIVTMLEERVIGGPPGFSLSEQ